MIGAHASVKCRTNRESQVSSILRAATISCVLGATCGMVSASANRSRGASSASESHSLQDLARQLEVERSTYRFSWPPDLWHGGDKAAAARFLADNDQRVRDLRRELGKAHTLGENPLESLDTARTVCNVLVAAAVIARDKDDSESVKYLCEVFSAVSRLPNDAEDSSWRSLYISALLPILQPGVQECGGLSQLDSLVPLLVTLEKQLQAEYFDKTAPPVGASSAVVSGIARLRLMRTAISIWEFERSNRRLPTSLDEVPLADPNPSEADEDPPLEWNLVDGSIYVSWAFPQYPPVRLSMALKPKEAR
jgi:hypothetical protein